MLPTGVPGRLAHRLATRRTGGAAQYRGRVLEGPVQIAYAVDDVERAAAGWVAQGVGPFFLRRHIELADVEVRGRAGAFDHSSAFAQWGAVMVELIQQHDGDDDPLVGSSGVHHMAHFVDDFDGASAALTAAGHDRVLFARTATGMPFAFHDGGDRGHLIEIYERTEPLVRFYEMVWHAAIGWDGSDPIRRL